MLTSADPLAVYRIAEKLLECSSEWLSHTEAGPPHRACVVTGEISWDDCECGQLVVAIRQGHTSNNFPFETGTLMGGSGEAAVLTVGNRGCGPPLFVFELMVSILRCSPTGGEDPNPPLCSELQDAARISVEDAWAVRQAVRCCLGDWLKQREITDYLMRTQTFVGSDGMCQGSELVLNVGIVNKCFPCDDGPGGES